jgi:hypothetical protein
MSSVVVDLGELRAYPIRGMPQEAAFIPLCVVANGSAGHGFGGAAVEILLSTLPVVNSNPITVVPFTSTTPDALATGGVAYQFLEFQVLGFSGIGAGLNEIRVYGTAIPEPSSTVACSAFAALTFAWWVRRRAIKA